MNPVELDARSILTQICSIVAEGERRGGKIPEFVSPKTAQLFNTRAYQDALRGVDTECVGKIVGNRSRWDAGFSKFFTLKFLAYIMTRTPNVRYAINLGAYYDLPNPPSQIRIYAYDMENMTSGRGVIGPTVFIGEPRFVTIKSKVQFPNITKIRKLRNTSEHMYKWVNMRYITNDGEVSLAPLPKFGAERVDGGRVYVQKPTIKSLDGWICKFSYAQLAVLLRGLVLNCVNLLVGNDISPEKAVVARQVFNLINLIQKRNLEFKLVTGQYASLELFASTAPSGDGREIRINDGDEAQQPKIFILFDTHKNLLSTIETGGEVSAYNAQSFTISDINLYSNVDSDAEVCGLLFSTEDIPVYLGDNLNLWEQFPALTDFEILSEEEILDTFTST